MSSATTGGEFGTCASSSTITQYDEHIASKKRGPGTDRRHIQQKRLNKELPSGQEQSFIQLAFCMLDIMIYDISGHYFISGLASAVEA